MYIFVHAGPNRLNNFTKTGEILTYEEIESANYAEDEVFDVRVNFLSPDPKHNRKSN